MIRFLLPALFVFTSCQNIRHITNIHLRDLKSISKDKEYQKKLDKHVQLKKEEDVKECTFVKEYTAKDNIFDQGEKWAVYYAKDKAYELDANTVVLEKQEQVGNYGHAAKVKIYNCSELKK